MRAYAFALLSVLACGTAQSGPLGEQFERRALGIPWRAHLDDVVGMLPGGQFVFVAEPFCRGYVVSDGQPLFGVPRDGYKVIYTFDGLNRLQAVTFDIPPERRAELYDVLQTQLGASSQTIERSATRSVRWAPDMGVRLGVLETRYSKFPVIWVTVYAPGARPSLPVC